MPSMELVITCGRARKRVRKVAGPVFLIGSSMDCDLILGDPLMPAVHSYVLITAYGVRLRHLGELPAIRVNGQTWEVTQLVDQDRIDIGSFAFLVRLAWPVEGRDLLPLATAEPVSGFPEPYSASQRFDAHQEAAQIRRRHI
ncbi:MAG: hypothetical protein GXY58_17010 [Planctomycetaceae bacterium]|nr:hypothetical protein [Planctomycetaceae bacterium]